MNNALLLKAANKDGSDVKFSERMDYNFEDFSTYKTVTKGELIFDGKITAAAIGSMCITTGLLSYGTDELYNCVKIDKDGHELPILRAS